MYKCNFFIPAYIVILSLMFNSCKKDSSSNSGPLVSEACQLISANEAQAITGDTYTETTTSKQDVVGLKICDYKNNDSELFQIALTQTSAINGGGLTVAKQYYESTKTAFPNRVMVTGIGTEAFINGHFIYVLYNNDYYFNIYISHSGLIPVSTLNNYLKSAANKAIENLEKLL